MRVLHLTPGLEPEVGGIPTFVSRLSASLAARGHAILVVSAHGTIPRPDDEDVEGVAIRRVPFFGALHGRSPRHLLAAKQRVARAKHAFAPDLVHLHVGGPIAFLHLATAAEAPAPLVITAHDLPPPGMDSPSLRQALSAARAVAAVSEIRHRELRDQVDPSRLRLIYSSRPVLAAEAPAADHPLLFTAGRLVPEKGFDVAIRALALLAPRWPAAELVIAGEGPEAAALRELAGTDRVRLLGRISTEELARWYRRAWVTLMPSRHSESFGLVALEAMHAGCPVVASRVGGLGEVVVEDGVTGDLVPPDDPAALAGACAALLESADRRRQRGDAGRARARARFDWDACVTAYERLYEEAR